MITIVSGSNVATIPAPVGFALTSTRPQASRQTLRGTMIHQYAAKSITVSAPKLKTTVSDAQAVQIEAIDAAGGTCYFSEGTRLFLVTIDAQVSGTAMAGKKSVEIEFRIVREITWA